MKHVFLQLFFLLCASVAGFSQVKGIIVDKSTGKPVAFANIWVENENVGSTSSEKGEFSLSQVGLQGKTLVISCLGYERTRVPIPAGSLRVALTPSAIALKEVTVKKSTKRHKFIVNKLDEHTAYSFGSNGTPWIVAQYIPYKPGYAATPFLDEVSLVALSNIKNATFKLHLLHVGENGAPGEEMVSVPLMGVAQKGIKTVKLDVSQHDLKMPEQGLFIAFEWLILKQNRYEPVDPDTGQKEGPTRVSYEPSIRCYGPDKENANGWIYHQGKWTSTHQREGDAITFAAPHFQLTLSN
ncbi:carboxypeptidase-like regulatory domain-containing protein [Rufibacter sediminis]|uniref:Carboxypeptidase-like regulatory domain-containing protein n=1 Tax=Rufibacter sediminis TaxID=2762756 RepID=A0ABR6VSW5_9BACT|nr:carboxypeptidase-like regulatory domain-containing protein [Rufibacter sediminis]MBC3539676.1 carboxypeptidase-like regulatory domain-containing protein [Rufibacter sediminis]